MCDWVYVEDTETKENQMLILTEIMTWLKVELDTARRILAVMEMGGIDFSEATTAQLKRAAKAAQKEIAA